MTGEQLYDDIYALSDYLWMEYNQRIDAVARPRIEWLAKKAWLRRERDADVVALLNERYSIGAISRLYDPRTPVELLNANVQLVRHRLAGLEWNARFRRTFEKIGMYWSTFGVPKEHADRDPHSLRYVLEDEAEAQTLQWYEGIDARRGYCPWYGVRQYSRHP